MTSKKCQTTLKNSKNNWEINPIKSQFFKEKSKILTDKKMSIFIKQNNKLMSFLSLLNSLKIKPKKKLKNLNNFKDKLID